MTTMTAITAPTPKGQYCLSRSVQCTNRTRGIRTISRNAPTWIAAKPRHQCLQNRPGQACRSISAGDQIKQSRSGLDELTSPKRRWLRALAVGDEGLLAGQNWRTVRRGELIAADRCLSAVRSRSGVSRDEVGA
jgi:hypothetical protein